MERFGAWLSRLYYTCSHFGGFVCFIALADYIADRYHPGQNLLRLLEYLYSLIGLAG